jgi:hypothetical protein
MPRIVLLRQTPTGPDRITLEVRPRVHRGASGVPSIGGAVKYSRTAPVGRSTATVSRAFYVDSRREYEQAITDLKRDGYEVVPTP